MGARRRGADEAEAAAPWPVYSLRARSPSGRGCVNETTSWAPTRSASGGCGRRRADWDADWACRASVRAGRVGAASRGTLDAAAAAAAPPAAKRTADPGAAESSGRRGGQDDVVEEEDGEEDEGLVRAGGSGGGCMAEEVRVGGDSAAGPGPGPCGLSASRRRLLCRRLGVDAGGRWTPNESLDADSVAVAWAWFAMRPAETDWANPRRAPVSLRGPAAETPAAAAAAAVAAAAAAAAKAAAAAAACARTELNVRRGVTTTPRRGVAPSRKAAASIYVRHVHLCDPNDNGKLVSSGVNAI